MCIYRNFCPKIGCHGNAPLSLVYVSVTDEYPNGTNSISKPNSAWMCRLQLKLWQFLWFFGLFWPKFGCHGNAPWDPCNQKIFWDWSTRKTPVISNRILVVSRRNAFICFHSNFVPKLVAMVTPLCPLCTGVSQMNSRWHKPYFKTKLCMDVWLTTEVMAIFAIFWLILAKIWLPWQRPLDPCNQKCLIWIGRP